MNFEMEPLVGFGRTGIGIVGGEPTGCGASPVQIVAFAGPGNVVGRGVNEVGFVVGGAGKEEVAHCGGGAG